MTDTEGQHPQGAARVLILWRIKRFIYRFLFQERLKRFLLKEFCYSCVSPSARALSKDGERCEGGSGARGPPGVSVPEALGP